MSEPEPQAVWIMPPKRRGARGWIVVALIVLATAIAAATMWFLWPKADGPQPYTSSGPAASSPASPTPTVPPTGTPVPAPTASDAPDAAPGTPPTASPEVSEFAGQVGPVLDDATTGMSFLGDSGRDERVQVIEQLQQDAERLSDAPAPETISDAWRSTISNYTAALVTLRSEATNDAPTSATINRVNGLISELNTLLQR